MIDSRMFDREKFVKGATEVGLALPIAEVFADRLVRTDTFLRGERPDRAHESERVKS